jgi:hypothetical protein
LIEIGRSVRAGTSLPVVPLRWFWVLTFAAEELRKPMEPTDESVFELQEAIGSWTVFALRVGIV